MHGIVVSPSRLFEIFVTPPSNKVVEPELHMKSDAELIKADLIKLAEYHRVKYLRRYKNLTHYSNELYVYLQQYLYEMARMVGIDIIMFNVKIIHDIKEIFQISVQATIRLSHINRTHTIEFLLNQDMDDHFEAAEDRLEVAIDKIVEKYKNTLS